MKLLIASQNKGKIREYDEILAGMNVQVIGLGDIGLGDFEPAETGDTFEANAIEKVRAYAERAGMLTLADDSGLEVEALDGRPGIYSARYGGPGLDDAGRRALLLKELQGVPDAERAARFVCVIAVHDPANGQTHTLYGECVGSILQEERDGGHGFGYDPLFLPDGYDQSMAELPPDIKNRISHRGRAAAQLPDLLVRLQQS